MAAGVVSFNGRAGAVTLTLADVTGVGGAPLAGPNFTGVPGSSTPVMQPPSGQIATCGWARAGVTDGSDAAVGQIGEFRVVDGASGLTLPNNVPVSAVQISLTAGDWDIWGRMNFAGGGASNTQNVYGGISVSPTQIGNYWSYMPMTPAGGGVTFAVVPIRVSLTATTTFYITGQAGYSTGTPTMQASIMARRAR
jgi:hypothetical protein